MEVGSWREAGGDGKRRGLTEGEALCLVATLLMGVIFFVGLSRSDADFGEGGSSSVTILALLRLPTDAIAAILSACLGQLSSVSLVLQL